MGVAKRARNLRRIIARATAASPKIVQPVQPPQPTVRHSLKRWVKVVLVLGWGVAILLWGFVR